MKNQLISNFKPSNFPHTNSTHPITGIQHRAVDTGWEPEIYSYPSDDLKRFKSLLIQVPEQQRKEFLDQMISIAKSMGEMTGQNVEWHYIRSNDNPFGDFGFFKVTK